MGWCYEVFCKDRKLKNNFEKVIYKIWLNCGVSPSILLDYCFERDMKKIERDFYEKEKIQDNQE